jgi:hypothetical protein
MLAMVLLLASACTTQVGGMDSYGDMNEDREDRVSPDAAPAPDALIVNAGPCGEEGSDADFTSTDGTCYEYFFQGSTWAGAKLKCEILGGELATINDEVANGILASLVPTAFPTAWLGGTDESTEGTWTWDGVGMTYTNWRAGEPNNGNGSGENCMIIESDRGGTWDDRPCSDTTSYICQR